jgi:DNA polymerase-1
VKRGIDIETTSLEPTEGEISLLQVYEPGGKCTVYDMLRGGKPNLGTTKLSFTGTGGKRTIELPLEGIAHNATFEEGWLRTRGYEPRLDDTMIASQVFYTGTNAAKGKLSHSLASCVSRELKRELPKDEQGSDWSVRPLTRHQLEYAARDAIVLPELFDKLMTKVHRAGLDEVYALELRVARAVDQMQRNGFAVHEDRLDELVSEVTEQAERLKAELEREWGINPGSTKQLREYFELDKVEGWPKTPAGAPKTDQDALKALVDEEPSVAKWVEWKEIEKIRSTYGKSIRDKLVDGRVHAGFKPFGTAKGRFSSSNPNLQNIPKRGELGPRIRGLFWAGAEDRVLIKADYASIELWLAAVRWEDPYMQDALQQGVNMHVATAAALFNVKAGEVAKEQNSRMHHERFPGLERALKAPLRDMANSPCWSVVGQGCGFQVFQ